MLSHGISTRVPLTAIEFSYICPAIVNQIDGRYCVIHATSEKTETPPKTYSLQVGTFVGEVKHFLFNLFFDAVLKAKY